MTTSPVNHPAGTKRRAATRAFGVIIVTMVISPAAAETATAPGEAVPVEVITPERRPLVRELRLPATLMADEQVELYAKVSGYIDRVDVDIGARVAKDDVLIQLVVPEMADELKHATAVVTAKESKVSALRAVADQAAQKVEIARAEVLRFEAKHELDEMNLKRQVELREGKAISQQALDEARIAHRIAEADLAVARARVAGAEADKRADDADVLVAESDVTIARAHVARLETLSRYARIRAPFDGIITARHVDHGAFARSAAEGDARPLLRLANTDRIRIGLDIPESDAPYVDVGTPAEIDVEALESGPIEAVVSRIAEALRPETHTMRAEIDIENDDNRFQPGMFAVVVLKFKSKPTAMMIPSKAIRAVGRKTAVFVAENGVVKALPIRVGYDDGIWAEVTGGLQGDEQVITAASGTISPGTPVSAIRSTS